MAKRRFKWVHVYWHSSNTLHLRFIPNGINVEALGFPHGIALAQTFTNTDDAYAYAERIDNLFNALKEAIRNEPT